MHAKLEVRIFSHFGAVSKNLWGHVTLATPRFRKKFQGSCRDFPWEHARQI